MALPTDQQVHIEAWQSSGLSQVVDTGRKLTRKD